MREIHGIADAKRAAIVSDDLQTCTVEDAVDGNIKLRLSTSNYPALLTPDQAEYIARLLLSAAKRARANGKSETGESV